MKKIIIKRKPFSKSIQEKLFKEYKELPLWVQNYLGMFHEHVVTNDYYAPEKYNIVKEKNGKEYKYTTKEYDKWFDENQKLYYREDYVIKLIQALLKGNEIQFE